MKKLLFLLGFVLTACGGGDEAAVQATVWEVALPTVSNITVRGTVESVESRNVYSTVGLTIQNVYVEEGQVVAEGQLLAVLDSGDLELSIAQQRATLEATRQTTQNMVQESLRMLNEAEANLRNNTNMHILGAEAALNAATTGLDIARQNYDNALRDYQTNSNPQVVAANSALTAVQTELDSMRTSHDNVQQLYTAGVITREEFRLSENGLIQIQNQFNDAQTALENALEFQQRTILQLRTALDAAGTARQDAQELLTATRRAAAQEVEMLRAAHTTAEINANTEPMEIAIQLMERQLQDSKITAPISGTITAVTARPGASAIGPMFVIDDVNNLRIITSFREYDITLVEEGMEVLIISDATGRVETGVINRINPAALPHSPVVEFEAEILVTSEDSDLRIGMNTRVVLDS